MTCSKCGNQQFHARRENHEVIGLVCSVCKDMQPIKKKETKRKIVSEDIIDNNQGEL
jgi:hypothetical protein